MQKVTNYFQSISEPSYGDFISKLSPSVPRETILGVRVPFIRSFSKQLDSEEINIFLNELPHQYYEENLLHAFLIGKIKDYDECIKLIEEFLPYCNGWAITDTMGPKCLSKNLVNTFKLIKKWISNKDIYTERFAIWCLMTFFLDDTNFKEEYLKIPLQAKNNDYYVRIMIAWYYATALSKQYETTIKLIESKVLDKWIQNKTIQKAIESSRVSCQQKDYLKRFRK